MKSYIRKCGLGLGRAAPAWTTHLAGQTALSQVSGYGPGLGTGVSLGAYVSLRA